jgi:hypothetical protein
LSFWWCDHSHFNPLILGCRYHRAFLPPLWSPLRSPPG